MARVKRCEVCGKESPPNELFCPSPCGSSLAFVPESDAPASGAAATPAALSHPSTTSHFELVFSWGAVAIGDRLRIGRDGAFSAIADQIIDMKTVSGRHAEVFTDAGTVKIRHISETNPTYVEGRPMAPGEVLEVTDGCDLAFSRALRATVRRIDS